MTPDEAAGYTLLAGLMMLAGLIGFAFNLVKLIDEAFHKE